VLVAPDKFKGSLAASEVAAFVAAGLHRRAPEIRVRQLPVADGGEGTLDAAISAGFSPVPVRAAGPTGRPVQTAYAYRDDVAIVELADVSGLGRLPRRRLDPLDASSYGVGQVMRAALDAGAKTIIIGLGGSACTDGGAGLMQALGARLLDRDGIELPPGGGALAHLDRVDLQGLHPRAHVAEIVVLTDVDNPLLGLRGAAAVYGPQKGATASEVELLEAALGRWAELVNPAAAEVAGTGAAGGVAFAAIALLGATLRRGIAYLLELISFREALAGASLVITGEGSLDHQTLSGKAAAGVASVALEVSVPVVAVAGRVDLSPMELKALGIYQAHALLDIEPDADRCLRDAGTLLERVADERIAPLLVSPRARGTRS
jgi:glycerate 2-kinase